MSLANSKAVAKALERLVNTGSLYRVATGIYVRPVIDQILGTVMPGIEDIAEAIIKRDKARAVPTGSYALYKLGLTTQVPMNVVFYTDSSQRMSGSTSQKKSDELSQVLPNELDPLQLCSYPDPNR